MKAKLKTLLPCGGKKKHPQSIWGLKINNSPQEPGFGLLVSEMPLPKVSRVLKLLSQSAAKVQQSRVCGWVCFGERDASAGDTKSADTHTLSSISVRITKQRFKVKPIPQQGRTIFSIFEWLQLRGIMFINSVHYSGVHEEVCVRVCTVCVSPLKFPVQVAAQ